MAGRGPAPKQQHQRERDTRRRQADLVSVEYDGIVRGPELEGAYGPQTLAWYETWRKAPQAQLFEETDWLRLVLLAPIVEAYFRKPNAAALTEIRLNEEKLGATYVDRLRARIRVEREAEDAEVVTLKVVGKEDVLARMRGDK